MFYPFNSAMAARQTLKARDARGQEQDQLIQAYLMIAQVYIQRAADRGQVKTSVYSPYEIIREMIQILEESGFEASIHPHVPCRIVVSWEEE